MSNDEKNLIVSQETRIVSSLRAARAALGWSQPQLAKRAGVSLVALARLEAGMTSPRLSTLVKLRGAIENAGVRIADDCPVGGFTLTVHAQALIDSPVNGSVVGDDSPMDIGEKY